MLLVPARRGHSTALKSIGDAVIATDDRGQVLFMNSVTEALTGWSAGESHGKHLTEVFPIVNEETRQPVENPVEKVLATGHIVDLANHTVLIARDGKDVPIDDSAAPILDDQGCVAGVILDGVITSWNKGPSESSATPPTRSSAATSRCSCRPSWSRTSRRFSTGFAAARRWTTTRRSGGRSRYFMRPDE
jgi:PAS domain S-box-containing protein